MRAEDWKLSEQQLNVWRGVRERAELWWFLLPQVFLRTDENISIENNSLLIKNIDLIIISGKPKGKWTLQRKLIFQKLFQRISILMTRLLDVLLNCLNATMTFQ